MLARLVSGEASSWLGDRHLLDVSSHGLSSVCVRRERKQAQVSPSLLIKTSSYNPIRLGPAFMASFNMNNLLKGPISKNSPTESWGFNT